MLKKNSELTNGFIYNYEHINRLGGQDDPKKGKSLRGLEEFWPSEGEFWLTWKGKGYKMILDVLLVRFKKQYKKEQYKMVLERAVNF